MIYCLYHYPTEKIGLIERSLKDLNLAFKEIHLYDGDGLPRMISDLEGLIIMGGPMSVHDEAAYPFLTSELRLLEQVFAHQKPVLGICLGAQLIAKALGARVAPQGFMELGWQSITLLPDAASDPLFKDLPSSMKVLHWHGDTFDIPSGAVHLASSRLCPTQAFRWGDNTYGLQFHFEVTPTILKTWLRSQESKEEVKRHGYDPEAILSETPSACVKLKPTANLFFSSYLKRAFSPQPSMA